MTQKKAADTAPELTFEEAFARLEQIVRNLEAGEAGLDDSLKLFEEGVLLTRRCAELLDKAEARIKVLVAGENGVQERPFTGDVVGTAS